MATLNPTVVNATNGQAANTPTGIMTVGAGVSDLAIDLILFNTSTTLTETIEVQVQPDSGTARAVAYNDDLKPKYTFILRSLKLAEGDQILVGTTTAATVNWTITKAQETI